MRLCFLGTEERRAYLQSLASPGTKVEILDYKPKAPHPISIESMVEEYLYIPWVLEMCQEAERRGYDAVITSCLGDPGIDGARELLRIPVIAPAESAFHVACMLGHMFSIITPLDTTRRPAVELVRKAGLQERLASVRVLGCTVLEAREGKEETYRKLYDLSLKCVQEDHGDTIILACASVAHSFGDRLAAELPAPVINPLRLSVKVAEMLVGAGLRHSKRAYPAPPKPVGVGGLEAARR
ncbi:MAG: hydrogenase expression protein HupH [Armatimonadetes bacterium]|nr:hydrogenase expression protein HupH [Armatimonadota bacterium]